METPDKKIVHCEVCKEAIEKVEEERRLAGITFCKACYDKIPDFRAID